MRILHVIPFFTPAMGGSAMVAYQMARHLGRRGHQVTLLTSDYGMGRSRFAAGPFEVTCLRAAVARWGFYVTPALADWAAAHLGEFDLIHMHTVRTYQNAVLARYAARRRVPYIVSAHGTLPIIVQRQAAKRIYDRLAGRSLLAAAGRLIAVSPLEAEQYREAGIAPGRIRTVLNGLDLDEYTQLPPRGSFRSGCLGLGPDTRIILYLGRLHPIKGLGHLVESFSRLHAHEPGSVLVIAGPDDGELANLHALTARLGLQDHVRFVGPLYEKAKLAALVDADVLASPAVHEIFGLVPFEALMCGTPVVVTAGCGSGRLLADAGAGYLVQYGDVPGLAAMLWRALANRAESERRVRAGQAYVRASLDWTAVITGLEDVYREVCAEVAPGACA